jgi:hypothetical protein
MAPSQVPPQVPMGDDELDDEDMDSEEEDEGEDDESGDENDDDDERRQAEIQSVRARLAQSPGSFWLSTQLISLLKAEADLSGVREAREALASARPLPEALWLEWIEDEERLASDDELPEARQARPPAHCLRPPLPAQPSSSSPNAYALFSPELEFPAPPLFRS